jgi:hypothetical protein
MIFFSQIPNHRPLTYTGFSLKISNLKRGLGLEALGVHVWEEKSFLLSQENEINSKY